MRLLLLPVLLVGAVAVPASAAGCPKRPAVQLTEADAGTTVTVRCGTPVVLSARGFQGGSALTSDAAVVRADGYARGPAPVTGPDTWQWTALRSGRATVTASRLLPFRPPAGVPQPLDVEVEVVVTR